MPNIMVPHTVQLGVDNTDVFGGAFGVQMPSWFRPRQLRVQVTFSDSDALFSLRIGGRELARNSAPHRCQADNIVQADWNSPHFLIPVPQGVTDFEILLDFNAVTAGFGLAILQWEG